MLDSEKFEADKKALLEFANILDSHSLPKMNTTHAEHIKAGFLSWLKERIADLRIEANALTETHNPLV